MNRNQAIISDYYLFGIELGIIDFNLAIDWADAVIEQENEPSGEIIDVALSRPRGRNGVMESLKEIQGDRAPEKSGSYLLNDLIERLNNGEKPKSISTKALSVCWATHMKEDIRYEFDFIDDELSLAEQGIYGSIETTINDLREALAKHGEKLNK